MSNKKDPFSRFARSAAKQAGRPATFGIAVAIIIIWGMAGPIFKFSDTWQLVINTSTTIITFLMVFLIQNTQNRDSEAMHLKLDELIRASSAHNALLDIEELTEEELDNIKLDYENLAEEARPELEERAQNALSEAVVKKAAPPIRRRAAAPKKRKPVRKQIQPPAPRSKVSW